MSDALNPDSRPRLPRGVKLRRDEARDRWTLLAPERIFEIDDIAAAVLASLRRRASLHANRSRARAAL